MAFFKGRNIQENNLIAHEILHTMEKKRGRHGLMLIKADMAKAYDWVSCKFLKVVLRNFGLDEVWI